MYPSKGYRIRAVNPGEIREIFQIRSAIEGFCVYKLAQEIETEKAQKVLTNLRECLDEQRQILLNGDEDTNQFTDSENIFHNLIIGYLDNHQFSSIFNYYEYKMRELKFNFLQHQDRLNAALKEHTYIISLLENGEAENAYEFMLTHILPSTYFSLRDLDLDADWMLPDNMLAEIKSKEEGD